MSVIMEETSRAGFGPAIGYAKSTPEDRARALEHGKRFEATFLNKEFIKQ